MAKNKTDVTATESTSIPTGFDKPARLFGVEKSNSAEGGWVFVEATINPDGSITSFTKSVPDIKPVVLEKFKITVGKHWGAH